MWPRIALVIVGSFLLYSCTSVVGSNDVPLPDSPEDQRARLSPGKDTKRKIQVRGVQIPSTDLNRYPELAAQRVGFGLSRMLVKILSDTGRFDLFEAPEQVVKWLGERWRRTEDGIDVQNDPPSEGSENPQFLMSIKLFDVAACVPEKRSILGRERPTCRTRVGVQVRIENTTGQFIPGSTHPLSPQGRYVHLKHLSRFGNAQIAFEHSAVGKATAKAMRYAVLQALERFDRQGW